MIIWIIIFMMAIIKMRIRGRHWFAKSSVLSALQHMFSLKLRYSVPCIIEFWAAAVQMMRRQVFLGSLLHLMMTMHIWIDLWTDIKVEG